MTTKELATKEEGKSELTLTQARTEFNNWKTANKDFLFSKAAYYRACWRVHTLKLYKYFKGEDGEMARNDEELLRYGGCDKAGITVFREGCRIYKQFLTEVKKLPEFKEDQDAAEGYTEKLIDKTYAMVGNNSSYVGEISRTRMIEGSKRETEENLMQVKELVGEHKTIKDFTKAVQKKLGVLNVERAKGREKREEGRTPGTTRGGDKVMFNFRVASSVAPGIVEKFEKLSTSIGIRKKYAEMNSDEVGTFVSMLVQRDNKGGAGTEVPKDEVGRKNFIKEHMNHVIMALHGVRFPDDILDGAMEDICTITEPLAAKI